MADDLTTVEIRALELLRARPWRVDEFRAAMGLPPRPYPWASTRLLTRLRKRGLATFERGTDDRRITLWRATGAGRKNQAAVALGRLGGLVGGRVRAERLTPQRRSEIASAAARKRWHGGA